MWGERGSSNLTDMHRPLILQVNPDRRDLGAWKGRAGKGIKLNTWYEEK